LIEVRASKQLAICSEGQLRKVKPPQQEAIHFDLFGHCGAADVGPLM